MLKPWVIPYLILFYFFVLSSCRGVERTHSRIAARQDFHNELLRLEALALTRLPWNINAVYGWEVLALWETNGTANALRKRDDTPPGTPGTPPAGQGDMVLSLWKNTQFKVPVNNMFVKFDITPATTVVMTTSPCWGCTAVIMCSAPGQLCIFAHFLQENGPENTWVSPAGDVDFSIFVMGPIEDAIKQYKDQLGPTPFCVIFTPGASADLNVFIYRSRITGPNSINGAILAAFPSASILNIGYQYLRASTDFANDTGFGKIVLEWIGAGSSCAVGGASILNVFAEETWWKTLRFDDNGNPVTVDKTPCGSPSGSQDVLDIYDA